MIWIVLAFFACKTSVEESDPGDTDVAVNPYCDPAVRVPAPGGVATDTADAHADVFGAAAEPYHVVYQWPGQDPSRSAAFLWRTDVDTLATVVEWGEGSALTNRAEGASFGFGGWSASETVEHRIHEVRLCGDLQPGTTYSYRVGGDGHWSPTHTFTTPGAPGTFDSFRVAVAGDSRGAYETWGAVVAAMDAEDPDFILFSGDMVDLGPNQEEWDAWFEASGDVLARRALVPAHGNHEFLTTNYFAQFSLPGNEEWFAIDYGNLTLLSLNDTVRDLAVLEEDQVALMDVAWGARPDNWKVAMHHQALYSTSTTHGSYESLREIWAPAFDRHGVDVVFAGHNHIYERSVPIAGGEQVADGEGTVYFVTGGAGAPLYTGVEPTWFGAVANPIEHWILADFSADRITIEVRDLSGNVIDTVIVPR